MGANQSTDGNHDGSQPASGRAKTCYYELLRVDPQATEDEIKKAYRRKALELHPDRNLGNVEETTKLFAEIQSAWEVLSDPQERTWYDSHRNTILRGESEAFGVHYDHSVRITTSDDLMRLFTKFTGWVDFSDSSHGFFSVLRNSFDTIAREEIMAGEWQGLECIEYPSFGHSDDKYEDVVRPFYTVWNGFATTKTFSWMDVYKTADAPDRRVRRMMEKENRRLRDEGIREFNDTVRQLVAFVRKRDPRYKPHAQTAAERQKIVRDAATAQAARSRAANRAKMAEQVDVADWAKESDIVGQAIDEDISETEAEDIEEEFECVVCHKVFKSEKQFDTHEKSKKHIKAVQRLRKDMHREAKALELENGVSSAIMTSAQEDKEHVERTSLQEGEEAQDIDGFDIGAQGNEEIAPQLSCYDEGNEASTSNLPACLESSSSESATEDEYASREKIEERILGKGSWTNTAADVDEHIPNPNELAHTFAEQSLGGDCDSAHPLQPGNAKKKRAKKAAQRAVATESAHGQVRASTNEYTK
ncbi:MAG: hypothetical protein Q9195_009275 [Heterodermia aff. obscurata]